MVALDAAVPGERFVEPAYGSRSLSDVVPTVARALGAPLSATPSGFELPDASSYVVFLVDGLGARLIERHAEDAPFLAELLAGQQQATAGVPSTTAASLTSFSTSLTPGTHGLVGFTSRVPGTDVLHNNLWWDDDIDPREWQPHPTAFTRLAEAGVSVTAVNRREFATSGMTRASLRGAEFVGADDTDERVAAAVAASAARRSLTYLYDSDLDWTGHRWGVASYQWLSQLSAVDESVERLREALPDDRRLVVVADHGMVDSPADRRVDVDRRPGLRDGVALMGGEARFRHLYCRPGAVDDVCGAWRTELGDGAEVLTRADAVARGWFGPVSPAVLPRLGDVMVACRGDLAVVASQQAPYEAKLIGMHGSLTPDEMLIPVVVA